MKVKHFVSGNHDHDTWWMLIKLSERSDPTSHVFWVTSMMVNVESVTAVQSMRETVRSSCSEISSEPIMAFHWGEIITYQCGLPIIQDGHMTCKGFHMMLMTKPRMKEQCMYKAHHVFKAAEYTSMCHPESECVLHITANSSIMSFHFVKWNLQYFKYRTVLNAINCDCRKYDLWLMNRSFPAHCTIF